MLKADQVLDAKGLSCPMPIVKTKKTMDMMEPDQVLEIHTTDKGAKADLAAWSKTSGHELLEQVEEGDVLKFWVRKGH